ncbi:MAG: hypothetical protein AAF809_05225 [Bacteroidota bacterium]
MTRTLALAPPTSTRFHGASLLNLALLVLFSLLLAAPAFAQPTEPSDEARERLRAQVDATLDRLDVTDEQRAAVAPILEASMLERLAVLQEYGIDPQNPSANGRPSIRTMRKMRGDIEDVQERTEEQLEEHLTDDQIDAWKDIEKERQAQMRARSGN